MRTACIAAVAVVLLANHAHAQPTARIEALRWMHGAWVSEKDGGTVREVWLGPANGLMVAANLTAGPGSRRAYEFLRIADTADGVSYFASPGGRAPVEFKAKELGERRAVFENATHDFPQRILYWREGDALMARIEGTINGVARSREWRFVAERSAP